MVHGSLEGSKALISTQNISRHSKTFTEPCFHSASETLTLRLTPKPVASQPKFPHRTSSVKRGQPSRKVIINSQSTAPPTRVMSTSDSVDAQTAEFRGKSFADLQPLTRNPPTPRRPRSKPHKTQQRPSEGSTYSLHPAVEALDSVTKNETAGSCKRPDLEPSDHLDHLHIREINVVAGTLVAPQAPESISKSKDSAGVVVPAKSAMSSAFPIVPASAQEQVASRRPSSPFTQAMSLPALLLPPLPHSGSDAPEDLKDAAEMSIARQISISHRQRELLVPIVPKVARHPTLVDVSGGSQLARKSQHLVLEDAQDFWIGQSV